MRSLVRKPRFYENLEKREKGLNIVAKMFLIFVQKTVCNISRKDFLFETLLSVQCHLGRVSQRSAGLRTSAKRAESDYPAHAQSIIRAFARHSYIL